MADGENTGPAYPPGPRSGDNAIGKFVIGVSPVGDIREFDWWRTVLSQYANSPRIIGILEAFADAIDPTQNLTDFFDLIWNVDTAQGYGLDVWGRIVGISRTVTIEEGSYFAFSQGSGPDTDTFGLAPFYAPDFMTTKNYVLPDEAFRRLVLAKAAFNITDGSIPSINRLLRVLFPGRGNAYVQDGARRAKYFGFRQGRAQPFAQAPFYSGQRSSTMMMTYIFEFPPTAFEMAVITTSNVLPRMTGVKSTIEVHA